MRYRKTFIITILIFCSLLIFLWTNSKKQTIELSGYLYYIHSNPPEISEIVEYNLGNRQNKIIYSNNNNEVITDLNISPNYRYVSWLESEGGLTNLAQIKYYDRENGQIGVITDKAIIYTWGNKNTYTWSPDSLKVLYSTKCINPTAFGTIRLIVHYYESTFGINVSDLNNIVNSRQVDCVTISSDEYTKVNLGWSGNNTIWYKSGQTRYTVFDLLENSENIVDQVYPLYNSFGNNHNFDLRLQQGDNFTDYIFSSLDENLSSINVSKKFDLKVNPAFNSPVVQMSSWGFDQHNNFFYLDFQGCINRINTTDNIQDEIYCLKKTNNNGLFTESVESVVSDEKGNTMVQMGNTINLLEDSSNSFINLIEEKDGSVESIIYVQN